MIKEVFSPARLLFAGLAWACSYGPSMAQPAAIQTGTMPLTDMSAFRNPAKSWSIVGDASADLKKPNVLHTSGGTGVLVNQPTKRNHSADLYTNFELGDADIELDYMMSKGGNSGIYLQGRYELQLEDSWTNTAPTAANNGGIYQRWDDSKPEGQKGYEGSAPRQNVSRAPGLWQHLKISFQAPRFDASGQKTENAKMLRVELNGVLIQENVELTGPTRGAMSAEEKATGPLRIQGDHGAVAFRNISITDYSKPRPELVDLKYTVYEGPFEGEPDFKNLPPEAEGTSVIMTGGIKELPKNFLIRYTGTLRVAEAGDYEFNLNASGGRGLMKLNNKVVIPMDTRNTRGKVTLPAGDIPFELLYTKIVEWDKPAIGLAVIGPGIREYIIGDAVAPGGRGDQPAGPIMVEAPVNTMLRSFMDLPSADNNGPATKVVHAISVGSPVQVNYTYDLDKGTMVQVWRGGFLDATPMWYSRGNGSSRPVGAVQQLAKPAFTIARLGSPQAAWVADTAGSGYRPKGYVLDANDQPTFRYMIYGSSVEDKIRVLENGQGIQRELTVQNPSGDLYAKLAEGSSIEPVSKEMYLVDGKSYYLRLDDAGGAKPVVRDANGRKELLVPVNGKLSYSIIF